MKRLIITIIVGILTISVTGCVGYRHHHWHGGEGVVVTGPRYSPVPVYPRRHHRRYAPYSMPGYDHHRH